MIEEFLEQMADALERDEGTINIEDEFRAYDEWDSLSALSLMSMINEEYDVIIPRKEFEKLVTVKDLAEYIQANQSD